MTRRGHRDVEARRRRWAHKALYAVVGWFALVPASVAAMAVVKVLRGDPRADPGDAAVLIVMAVATGLLAVALYLPVFRPRPTVGADPMTADLGRPGLATR